eukprot:542141_1
MSRDPTKNNGTGRYFISFQCSFENFDKFDAQCKEIAATIPESAMEYAIADTLEENGDFNRDPLNAFINVEQQEDIEIKEILIAPEGYKPEIWTTKEFKEMQQQEET